MAKYFISKHTAEEIENTLDSAVTRVKINGITTHPSNGVVDLGTVITSHQDISGKQDRLVDGENIKTINGQSILGEGNISISGDVTVTVPLIDVSSNTMEIAPNVFYRWIEPISNLTITLSAPSDNTILNNYMFEFITGASGCTLGLPSTILWVNGVAPSIRANKTYQVSIVNNNAIYAEF